MASNPRKPGELKSKKLEIIDLPEPRSTSGKTVFKALAKRRTVREVSDKKISLKVLSNILWAACGVNRKKGPFGITGRTAASASNSQEIDVYVALKIATYKYDAFRNQLLPAFEGDLRPFAIGEGQANYGDKAPVRLIYVVNINKLANTAGYQEPGLQNPDIQKSYYYVDTGMIAANVYLYCASVGLAAWFHNCNKLTLSKKLNLESDQRVLFGQTIGYSKKN